MKELQSAIITWLRNDDTLVTLTAHAIGDFRIYAWAPDVDLKIPSLIVAFEADEIFVGRTIYDVKVRFESYHTDNSIADTIIQRVRALLVDATTPEKRSHGPAADISDDNVTIKSCELGPIETPVWNQDTRYWSNELSSRVIWAFV